MLLESFPRHYRNEVFLLLFVLIGALAFAFPVLPRGAKAEKTLNQLTPAETSTGRFNVSIPSAPATLFEALPVREPDYVFFAHPDAPENSDTTDTQSSFR
jgi:hypothetical protein